MGNEDSLDKLASKLGSDDSTSNDASAGHRGSLVAVRRFVYTLATLCLFGVSASLLIQITTRSVNIGVQGLGALAQLLTVWMSFLVIGNLEFDDKHIEIDYFVNKLPESIRRIVGITIIALCVVWAGGVLYSAFLAVQASMDSTIPTLGVPAASLHASPLIGMSLLVIAYLMKMKSRVENMASGGDSLD
jgi:TRAP-type C4-dicarboxylate transport system permease small subunit